MARAGAPHQEAFKKGELVKVNENISDQVLTEMCPLFKKNVACRIAFVRPAALRRRLTGKQQPRSYVLGFDIGGITCTTQAKFFEPLAAKCLKDAPALQIAALSATLLKLQDPMVKDLQRKLEETTLSMERASMEREDFRQGGGPCDVWGSPAECSHVSQRRYTEDLQDSIAEARNLLDMGHNRGAWHILTEAYPDTE